MRAVPEELFTAKKTKYSPGGSNRFFVPSVSFVVDSSFRSPNEFFVLFVPFVVRSFFDTVYPYNVAIKEPEWALT